MTDERQWSPEQMLRVRDAFAQMFDSPSMQPMLLERMLFTGCDQRRALLLIEEIRQKMRDVECVLWEAELWQAAVAGADAFAGLPLPAAPLPDRCQLWFLPWTGIVPEKLVRMFKLPLDEEFKMRHKLILPVNLRERGTDRLIRQAVIFGYCFLPQVEDIERAGPTEWCPWWRWMPACHVGEPLPSELAVEAAALSFMRQPFIAADRVSLGRQRDRAYERSHGELPPVREVILRRAAPRLGDVPGQREWSCSWMVRGHWRRRCERWAEGGPIYVNPHIKGPADKPLRAPRPTVYHVKR